MAGNTTRPENDWVLAGIFSNITDSLAEPHFLLSQDGTIISTNRAARKKFALPDANLETTNLATLMNHGAQEMKPLLQMWSRSKSPMPASITFKVAQDTLEHYTCKGRTFRPASNGESALIMLHCTSKNQSTAVFGALNQKIEQLTREIVERRNAEKEVHLLNLELEKRVADRTVELQRSNSELGRSLSDFKSAQDQLIRTERLASLGGMVAGVAHEINTPVGVCVTAVSYLENQIGRYREIFHEDMLSQQDLESLFSVASESFNIIVANLDRAVGLVSSFKQLAVDQTSGERRDINLKTYIDELFISMQPYIKHTTHSFNLICEDDINIDSFPGAIAQILSNLINNSMTHGLENIEDGLIGIEVTQEQDKILLHYSDNGKGIPHDDLARIFDPFFTTSRNQGGSGLGLNIVYNLVTDKLNGTISVASEDQQGTHFYIRIPVQIEDIRGK